MDFKGRDYNTIQHAGEYGNLCVAVFRVDFDGHAAGSIGGFGVLAGGIDILRAVAITDDMGNAQTMDIGYEYLDADDGGTDDPDGLFDGIDTGTAAATNAVDLFTRIVEGSGIRLIAENIGDVATGTATLIVYYKYNGNG